MSANITPQDLEFKLNHGDLSYRPIHLGGQIIRRSKRVYKGVYNFAYQGGAIGTVQLYDPVHGHKVPLALPPAFIIMKVLIDVITNPTSGGSATIALSSGLNAGDLKAATAISSYTGMIDGIPNNTAAAAIKVPSTQAQPGSIVTATIATAALTAGFINVHIEGYLSDAQ